MQQSSAEGSGLTNVGPGILSTKDASVCATKSAIDLRAIQALLEFFERYFFFFLVVFFAFFAFFAFLAMLPSVVPKS
jgi:hypothetical protein